MTDTATTRGPSSGVHCGPLDDTDGPWSVHCPCHRCHGYAMTACLNGHDTDGRYRVTVTDYRGRSSTMATETMDDGHDIMTRPDIRSGVIVDRWTDVIVSTMSRTRGNDTTRRTR